MPTLHKTELEVSDICFGGNVFGWTADQDQSFALINRFMELAAISLTLPMSTLLGKRAIKVERAKPLLVTG